MVIACSRRLHPSRESSRCPFPCTRFSAPVPEIKPVPFLVLHLDPPWHPTLSSQVALSPTTALRIRTVLPLHYDPAFLNRPSRADPTCRQACPVPPPPTTARGPQQSAHGSGPLQMEEEGGAPTAAPATRADRSSTAPAARAPYGPAVCGWACQRGWAWRIVQRTESL